MKLYQIIEYDWSGFEISREHFSTKKEKEDRISDRRLRYGARKWNEDEINLPSESWKLNHFSRDSDKKKIAELRKDNEKLKDRLKIIKNATIV